MLMYKSIIYFSYYITSINIHVIYVEGVIAYPFVIYIYIYIYIYNFTLAKINSLKM